MQKKDVVIGRVYRVKVGANVARVRLDSEAGNGWYGTNLATNRTIRVRTAAKLRGESVDQVGTTEVDGKARTFQEIRQSIRDQVKHQRNHWNNIVSEDLKELARRFGADKANTVILHESLNELGWRTVANEVTFVEPTEPAPPGGNWDGPSEG